jgi:Aldo/keto reductase family
VDQSAEPLIEAARRRNVGFVNAAPFGGGMLIKGPELQPKYCYAPASQATISRVREMERLCKAHDVPLAAAALQFSLRDVRVASTIVGMSEPKRIAQTIELADLPMLMICGTISRNSPHREPAASSERAAPSSEPDNSRYPSFQTVQASSAPLYRLDLKCPVPVDSSRPECANSGHCLTNSQLLGASST